MKFQRTFEYKLTMMLSKLAHPSLRRLLFTKTDLRFSTPAKATPLKKKKCFSHQAKRTENFDDQANQLKQYTRVKPCESERDGA